MRQIRVAQLLEIGVRKGKNRLDLIDGEIVDRRDVAELLHQSWAYKEVGPGSKAFPVWAPRNLYILWGMGRILVPSGKPSAERRVAKSCKFCAIISGEEKS